MGNYNCRASSLSFALHASATASRVPRANFPTIFMKSMIGDAYETRWKEHGHAKSAWKIFCGNGANERKSLRVSSANECSAL